MNFVRFVALLVLAAVVGGGPACAAPQASPAIPQLVVADRENQGQGNGQDEEDRQSQARARGVITGSVVGVDYAHGVVRLISGRGVLDIVILPGTSIIRPGNQYGTIADLVRGTRVAVYVSQVGGRLMAELIRIR